MLLPRIKHWVGEGKIIFCFIWIFCSLLKACQIKFPLNLPTLSICYFGITVASETFIWHQSKTKYDCKIHFPKTIFTFSVCYIGFEEVRYLHLASSSSKYDCQIQFPQCFPPFLFASFWLLWQQTFIWYQSWLPGKFDLTENFLSPDYSYLSGGTQ